jgi:hypothetical protein
VNLDWEEGAGFFNAFLKKADLIIYFSFHSKKLYNQGKSKTCLKSLAHLQ